MSQAAKQIKDVIAHAERYSADHGLRLTDPRRYVLQIIAGAEKPVGAYDVLEELRAFIKSPKPPTAYRALEFLQENGFIHRIESLNAYVACHAGHHHQGSQYMICDSCGDVAEIHLCSVPQALRDKTKADGFTVNFWNAELHGTCANCQ